MAQPADRRKGKTVDATALFGSNVMYRERTGGVEGGDADIAVEDANVTVVEGCCRSVSGAVYAGVGGGGRQGITKAITTRRTTTSTTPLPPPPTRIRIRAARDGSPPT